MNKQILNLRFKDKCPNCTTYFRASIENCPTCGTELDRETNDTCSERTKSFGEDDYITCPSCRVVNSYTADKCQTCGQPLQENRIFSSANNS